MSEGRGGTRGQGNVAAAMRRRVGGGGRASEAAARTAARAAEPLPVKRRRKREKVGKRSNPEYMMAGGYVSKVVHERVMEVLANRGVRDELFEELDRYGVQHDGKRVYYGDLAELLCRQWLQSLGVEPE